MAIPKYQQVRYTDDGCYEYQCLSCYAKWEWRGSSKPLQFCMCCGLKFEGHHESRDSDMPRWRFDYAKLHGERAAWDIQFPKTRPKLCWVIEKKLIWRKSKEVIDDWKIANFLYGRYTATSALAALKQMRQEETDEDEDDWMQNDDNWATDTLFRLARHRGAF